MTIFKSYVEFLEYAMSHLDEISFQEFILPLAV